MRLVRMKKNCVYNEGSGNNCVLPKHNFEAKKPKLKWETAVTDFSLLEQKLYPLPILDICNRDIVSYTISDKSVLAMPSIRICAR